MPVKILMPALSPTMTEGNLAKWLKAIGDKVLPGDVIAEIETDKATMEVEAVEEGILGKIIVPAGKENVKVNSVIAILLEEGEEPSVLDNVEISDINIQDIQAIPVNTEVKAAELGNTSNILHLVDSSRRIFASPLAKRIASSKNIDLSSIAGTGPNGRITKSDVLNIQSSAKPTIYTSSSQTSRNPEEYRSLPNSNIRKIIAKRLQDSKQTIPHFYLSIECNVDKLLDIRQDINLGFGEDKTKRISVNDFIIRAVAKALHDVPEANATWDELSTRYYNNIDISVAVAINDGLITPVIRNADQKTINKLSEEMKSLVKRARDNKLMPEEFQGGGFSISNLGMYGIKSFSAIINPPQSCILSIGESSKRAVVIDDQVKIATIMDVTLSCDHRVVDGAVGAKFLAAFKRYIEHPALMLI